MDLAFRALGWVPHSRPDIRAAVMHVAIDHTFWLNLVFGALAVVLVVVARRAPARASHCGHHH